jgi:peptidoglycan/xylan/chitin deacetylase (PgdA/CDA1 family)
MNVAMSLHARGPLGSATRMATVLSRFGPTPANMASRLDRYQAITTEYGLQPTWPVTACVLARHPDLLREYADRGAELALHGLVHGDHAALDEREQRDSIARALEVFDRAGIHAVGFRGPYLRYNQSTLTVLREFGLYHSGQALVFPLIDEEAALAKPNYRRALALYGALDARTLAVTPKLRDGLVDIPLVVPDDEILTERLGFNDAAAAAAWVHILDITYQRGELFTVQLHPERVPELGDALRAVLAEAHRRRPAIWTARLDAIAAWWKRRSRFSVNVSRLGECRYGVRIDADDDATILVRGLPTTDAYWSGRDSLCAKRDLEFDSLRIPAVGLSRRSPPEVRRFLAEEGFPIEASEDADAYGAHVDIGSSSWTEAEVLATVDAGPGPLVRIWRWPNGAKSALSVSGDIDALTLQDFALRFWETRASLVKWPQ